MEGKPIIPRVGSRVKLQDCDNGWVVNVAINLDRDVVLATIRKRIKGGDVVIRPHEESKARMLEILNYAIEVIFISEKREK